MLKVQSTGFKTLREKLGKLESRRLHSATEQQNSGGPLKGNVFIITYQTQFQKGQAWKHSRWCSAGIVGN